MTAKKIVGSILDLAVRAVPAKVAVSLGDEHRSFQVCASRANQLSRVFVSLGLKRGDRLLFWSPTSLDSFDVFFATQQLGVAFVPLNTTLSDQEIRQFITYIQPHIFVADPSLSARAEQLATQAGVLFSVIGGHGPGVALSYCMQAASAAPLPEGLVEEEDIHAIFLTSGSTGRPKGVMLSHRASWYRSYFGNSRTPASGGRGEVNMFPLFHWAGWHFSLCAWSQRRSIHLTPRADAENLNAIIETWQPSWMYAIPAVWERLLETEAFGRLKSLHQINTGTYRVEPGLVAQLRARFPRATLNIGWGATELGVGLLIGDDDIDRKPYSVGLPAPAVEVTLIDGELCGRSDQLMSGYFEMPDETDFALREGWYHSGDVAEMDEDGYFTIIGRLREIIRSGGETIAPAEVEAALAGFPGISDVAVVAIPDAKWGEIVCAVIVWRPNAIAPGLEELRSFLAPVLAPFKHPRRIVSVAAIPRTAATGQIQRARVRQTILEKV